MWLPIRICKNYSSPATFHANHIKTMPSLKITSALHGDLSRKAEKRYFPLESAYKLIEKPRTDRAEQPRSQ